MSCLWQSSERGPPLVRAVDVLPYSECECEFLLSMRSLLRRRCEPTITRAIRKGQLEVQKRQEEVRTVEQVQRHSVPMAIDEGNPFYAFPTRNSGDDSNLNSIPTDLLVNHYYERFFTEVEKLGK